MCWITESKLEKRTASKNLKVFKVGAVFDSYFKSYYYDFLYDFNLTYSTTVEPVCLPLGSHYILNGFHSYNPKKCKCAVAETTGWLCVKSGRIDLDIYDNTANIVECTIPKGATYYENKHGEIVSNQIIIKSVLEN